MRRPLLLAAVILLFAGTKCQAGTWPPEPTPAQIISASVNQKIRFMQDILLLDPWQIAAHRGEPWCVVQLKPELLGTAVNEQLAFKDPKTNMWTVDTTHPTETVYNGTFDVLFPLGHVTLTSGKFRVKAEPRMYFHGVHTFWESSHNASPLCEGGAAVTCLSASDGTITSSAIYGIPNDWAPYLSDIVSGRQPDIEDPKSENPFIRLRWFKRQLETGPPDSAEKFAPLAAMVENSHGLEKGAYLSLLLQADRGKHCLPNKNYEARFNQEQAERFATNATEEDLEYLLTTLRQNGLCWVQLFLENKMNSMYESQKTLLNVFAAKAQKRLEADASPEFRQFWKEFLLS